MGNGIVVYIVGFCIHLLFSLIARGDTSGDWKRFWSRWILLSPVWPLAELAAIGYWVLVGVLHIPFGLKILCADAGWLSEKRVSCPYPGCQGEVVCAFRKLNRYESHRGYQIEHTDDICEGFHNLCAKKGREMTLEEARKYLSRPELFEAEKEVEEIVGG